MEVEGKVNQLRKLKVLFFYFFFQWLQGAKIANGPSNHCECHDKDSETQFQFAIVYRIGNDFGNQFLQIKKNVLWLTNL
jgi:hypothetical protein